MDHRRLTIVLSDPDISHGRLTIFKFWICHFHLFSIVRVALPHIPVQIEVEMYSSKNMPVEKTLIVLQCISYLGCYTSFYKMH